MDLSAARRNSRDRFSGVLMLTQCLIDEAQISPAAVESAIDAVSRIDAEEIAHEPIVRLMTSKYKRIVKDIVWKTLIESTNDWVAPGKAWQAVGFTDLGWRLDSDPDHNKLDLLEEFIRSSDDQKRSLGLLAVNWLALGSLRSGKTSAHAESFLTKSLSFLEHSIATKTRWESFLGLWALARVAEIGLAKEVRVATIEKVIQDWLSSNIEEIGFYSGKALEFLPVADRSCISLSILDDLRHDLGRRRLSNINADSYDRPSIIVAYYCGAPWSPKQLTQMALKKFSYEGSSRKTLESLLRRLGEAGQEGLETLNKRQA